MKPPLEEKHVFTASKAVLLGLSLGAFCIQSFGAVIITVTEFNTDSLALTVHGGSGNALEGPLPDLSPEILDFAPGPGKFWINSGSFTSTTDLASLPATNLGTTIASILVFDDPAGDTVYITTNVPLSEGEYFLQDFSLEWSGTSLFDTLGVGADPLTAYWGTNANLDAASGTVQSASPLPEPTTYVFTLGFGALALVTYRRVRC